MDVELREALTRGFGPEPPHRHLADRIEAGHRAVRRRRIAGAVVTLAIASVVGSGAVTVLGDGEDSPSRVATDPTADPTTGATTDPAAGWSDGELARFDDQGTLEVRPGVTVLRHMLDLSVAQTAEELGIGEGTIKSHTSRGLAALEEALLAAER